MRPEHACRRVAEVHIVDIVTYRCDKGFLFGETGHKTNELNFRKGCLSNSWLRRLYPIVYDICWIKRDDISITSFISESYPSGGTTRGRMARAPPPPAHIYLIWVVLSQFKVYIIIWANDWLDVILVFRYLWYVNFKVIHSIRHEKVSWKWYWGPENSTIINRRSFYTDRHIAASLSAYISTV